MTESDALRALQGYYTLGGAVSVLPNFFMVGNKYEADLAVISRNHYVFEIEVKTSRADFLAEFRNKVEKHELLKSRNTLIRRHTKQAAYDPSHIPNRYYIASPKGLLSLSDIPEYAGWIELDASRTAQYGGSHIKVAKRAPLLHKNKCSPELMLRMLKSISTRFWQQR